MPTECFLLVCWVLMQMVKASDDGHCFHLPPSQCPPRNEICRCKRAPDEGSSSVGCCHINTEYELKEGLACAGVYPQGMKEGSVDRLQTTALHIQNATLDRLDVSAAAWKTLISFSVTDSKIQRLMGEFSDVSLVCLNLSSNFLIEMDHHALNSLQKLAMLDLSYNNLTSLPLINVAQPHFQLDISGNSQLNCNSITELMKAAKKKKNNLHFRNEKNETFCSLSYNFDWFNATQIISLDQVAVINKLNEECPKSEKFSCTCSAYRTDLVGGQQPTFTAKVDCSKQNLTELPPNLPANTIFLNVSHNNITSLDLLSTDPSYHYLREFYADHNYIDSIAKLEGTRFIDNFAVLSLRSNNLSSILTYILSNTFDRNNFPHLVHLGQNKLVCNCSTAQTLKWWLRTNTRNVVDYNEVLCSNLPERVIDLNQSKVCPFQTDWTDYIYYIIAAEIAMFLLLIGKVTYDYWVFKTHGYLPWPASKMPKMPCDWVFET
ncbi:unnamed protein product [Bemisia tabaci]|nr:unnamed protein product [Bemisia tabaci]